MAPRLKVLLAFNVDWFALSHFISYIRHFEGEGHEVHIFAEDTGRIFELSSSSVSVHKSLVGRRSGNPLQEILQLCSIIFSLAWLRPDIIECISLKPILTWGVLARFLGIRTRVCYITGLGSLLQGSSPFLPAIKFFLHFALSGKNCRVIVENLSIRNFVIRALMVSPDCVQVLDGVGVPLDIFYPALPPPTSSSIYPIKILLASRLLRDKGVVEYLEAASVLSGKYPGVFQFLLAGRFDSVNPTALSFDDIASFLSPCGCVQYLGVSSDVPSLLRSVHLFVLPSYHEGFPRSIIEAAACGIPVITTNVPGCSDAVVQGKTGLLVPPYDVSSLVSAIEYLVASPTLLHDMSCDARSLALEKYDENQIAKLHINFVLESAI